MMAAPVEAYFDTNVFDHIHKGIGMTAADLQLMKDRIRDGRVSLRLSAINLEEVLAAVERDPAIAFEELRLMVDLCGLEQIIKPHNVLISARKSSPRMQTVSRSPHRS